MSDMPAFAAPFAQPAGSPIRELFPYLSQPGMISLAGGYPSPSLFDAEGLAHAAAQAMTGDAQTLQYGATEGLPILRTSLAALMRERGIQSGAEQVMVTTGSQQAFDLLVRVLIEPGDTVLVEVPAYPVTVIGPSTKSFEALSDAPVSIFGWGMLPAGWAALMGAEAVSFAMSGTGRAVRGSPASSRSSAAATASTLASPPRGPTIWRPKGMPAWSRPSGSEMAG